MNIINEQIKNYIDGYYSPISEELAQLRQIGEKDRVPIILRDSEELLRTLLQLKQPKKIFEIGTAIGYSAIFFATMCKDAIIYTVEKDEYAFKAAKHNIEAFGLGDRIIQLFGDGQEQAEKLADKGVCDIDFVFIDAAKSHYKRFFDGAVSLCRKEALIVSDNVLQRGTTITEGLPDRKHRTNILNMREYVDYITFDPTLDTTLLAIGDGMTLTIYRGENE